MGKRLFTALAVALCWVGFLPTKGADALLPSSEADSLETPLHYYIEGLKQQTIHLDTMAARKAWQRALEFDSAYAPAHYKLGEMYLHRPESEQKGIYHAREAHRADTTNKFYLTLYAHAELYGGHFDKALSAFRQLMRYDRHNPENYRVLALLEEQMGNRPAAIRWLDSAEVLFGRNPQLGSLKRRMLIVEGRTEEALREAEEQIVAIPYAPDGYLVLGEIYVRTGNDSLARVHYQRAFELDSTNLETLLTLADFHLAHQEIIPYLDLTRRVFEHEEVTIPEKVMIFNRFVNDERFYRDFWPQISTLARTLAIRYPRDVRVVNLYGRHLLASGGVEQALEYYKLHLQDEPPQKDYYTMVVDIEAYLERPDSAENYLNRAITLFPTDCPLLLQRGHFAALLRHDEERAVECYREAIAVATTDSLRSVGWGFVGDSYQRLAQGAYPTIEKALQEHQRAVTAKIKGAKKAQKEFLKRMERCYAAYDEALQQDPENVGVLNNYAYFLSLEGRDLERALTMSSRAIALTPGNPTYLDTHGWVLFRLGRYEEAKRYLHQALSLDGQRSPELQMHYGDVLAALGEKFLAEVYWKRARDNGYDADEVEMRIQQLKKQP